MSGVSSILPNNWEMGNSLSGSGFDTSSLDTYKSNQLTLGQVPAAQSSFIPKSWESIANVPAPGFDTSSFDGYKSNQLSLDGGQSEKPWYQDGNTMQGYAGLASTLLQAAALPGQMKLAKVQRQGLEQNLAQAKVDSAFRANVRDNLSTHRSGVA